MGQAGLTALARDARIAGAATLIALLTVLSRLAGFGRNVVFGLTVGATDLGDIYLAANTVPNIIFEIVAGGALASLVVPLLAGPIAAGDHRTLRRTVSALLTLTVTVLAVLAVLLAIGAPWVISVLAPQADAGQREAGITMLRIFAPQLPLYGIGIVLTGVLQAHRRFAWPVIAPLLSSLTVIATYALFAVRAGVRPDPATVSQTNIVVLAVGTTAGVVVLSLCLLIPVSRLGIRVWPTLRLPEGLGGRTAGLALAGAVTVAFQQIAMLVTIRLALEVSGGANTVYNLAQTFYLLPWAVLAVPLAVAAFPTVAAAHARGEDSSGTVAASGRVIMLLSCLGAAGLVAVARPAANIVLTGEPGQARDMALAMVAFAPGLIGYGIGALHQRTLYAVGGQRVAAIAIGLGWSVAAVSAIGLSQVMSNRPVALALANSVGMLVLGLGLAIGVARRCGGAALGGLARAGVAGVVAAAVAALAGWFVVPHTTPGIWGLIGQGMLSSGVAVLVFVAVGALLDREDLRVVANAVSRRFRGKGTGGGG
ncbi:MAG TPA: lipid II flippase MurJ [Candidatus Limnocylindrales bacterium]|nr:lipid II flippase MurJ [Candidatus Limnocylindrales bacterium]